MHHHLNFLSSQLKRLEKQRASPRGLVIPRMPRQTLRGWVNTAEMTNRSAQVSCILWRNLSAREPPSSGRLVLGSGMVERKTWSGS